MARTFYIDSGAAGADSNAGTSKTSPWKHHPFMTAAWNGSYTHQPGDIFIFKGGVEWPSRLVVSAGGSDANRDFYGSDTSWFAGAAWTQPVLNMNRAAPNAVTFSGANYVTFDSFNVKGTRATSTGDDASIMINGNHHITISNCWIHDWTTTIQNTPGVVNDGQWGGIRASWVAPGPGTINNNVVINCEISNAENGDKNSGLAVAGMSEVANCKIHDVPNGVFTGCSKLHHTEIYNIGQGFDPDNHNNVMYMSNWNGSDPQQSGVANLTGIPCLIYSNYIHDCAGPEIIYCVPSGYGQQVWKIFNNLVVNCNRCIEPEGGAPASNTLEVYVYNNTYAVTGAFSAGYPLVRFGGRKPNPIGRLDCYNNHTIGGPGYAVGSSAGDFVSLNQGNNYIHASTVAASANGYDAPLYQPTTVSGATVDSGLSAPNGVTLSGLFTTDRIGATRPFGAAWDQGCYEWTGGGGGGPRMLITPTAINFGSAAAGASTATQFAHVSSVGGVAFSGAAASGSSTFQVVSGSPYTFEVGQAGDIGIKYQPAAKGNDSSTVSFSGAQGGSVSVSGIAYPILPGLTFEANSGIITSPFTDVGSNHVLQTVQTNSPSSGGRVSYGVQIPADGDYTVSALVQAEGDATNSFYINFDNEPTDPSMIWDVVQFTSGYQSRVAGWRGTGTFDSPQFPTKTWTLAAGLHELIIRGREANVGLGTITIQPNAPVIPPAPATPAIVAPANGGTGIAINTGVGWSEATAGCTFNVWFGTVNPPPQVASDITGGAWFPPAVLAYSTTYYWKVQARLAWTSNGQSGVVTSDTPVWSFTTVPITPPPNQPPQAGLTSDKTSGVGPLTVNFTLTSSDSDGTVVSGVWNNGIDAPETIPTPAASVSRSKAYPAASGSPVVYHTSWKVTDDDGLDSTLKTLDITISPTPVNQPPHAGISANQTAGFGPFQVTFTLTSSDPDGTVARAVIDPGDGSSPVTLFSPAASVSYPYTYAAVGVDTVRTASFQATDNHGFTSTVATVAITVKAAVLPPAVALTSPVEGELYTAPATVNFAATATQGTNPIAKVEFYIDGVKVGEDLTAPYTYSQGAVTAGDKTLLAKALDNQGSPLVGTSQPIHIHVMTAGTSVVPKIIYVST